MLGFSPLSSTPISALPGGVIYVVALTEAATATDTQTATKADVDLIVW